MRKAPKRRKTERMSMGTTQAGMGRRVNYMSRRDGVKRALHHGRRQTGKVQVPWHGFIASILDSMKTLLVACAVGTNSGQKIQRNQNPNCHFWRAWSKSRMLGAKAGYWACPLHSTPPKGGWQATSASPPAPDTPVPSPHIRKNLATPTLSPLGEWASEQGELLFVFNPLCCIRGPNKALPEMKGGKTPFISIASLI